MAETEWLTATDPHVMLPQLRDSGEHHKLRLFAAACCRRVFHLLNDPRSRQAVETAERFVSAQATAEELRQAYARAQRAAADAGSLLAIAAEDLIDTTAASSDGSFGEAAAADAAEAAWDVATGDPTVTRDDFGQLIRGDAAACYAAEGASVVAARALANEAAAGALANGATEDDAWRTWDLKWTNERALQCDLLRQIFGPIPPAA